MNSYSFTPSLMATLTIHLYTTFKSPDLVEPARMGTTLKIITTNLIRSDTGILCLCRWELFPLSQQFKRSLKVAINFVFIAEVKWLLRLVTQYGGLN